MNAITLRNILIASIVLILLSIGGLIYFAGKKLRAEAAITTHNKIDAELSSQDVERLKNLQNVLIRNKASIEKAELIVSGSKQYRYQDQIIEDLNAYARRTGVRITGYDFGATTTVNTPPSPGTPVIEGVKTKTVTVTLDSPVSFIKYLHFVRAIEQNLTKMQVSGINITPDSEDYNDISNPSVVLIVYMK